jgi:hypothetical protein
MVERQRLNSSDCNRTIRSARVAAVILALNDARNPRQ